jgi:hypothetical protein
MVLLLVVINLWLSNKGVGLLSFSRWKRNGNVSPQALDIK